MLFSKKNGDGEEIWMRRMGKKCRNVKWLFVALLFLLEQKVHKQWFDIKAGTKIFVRTQWKCCCCHCHQINFFLLFRHSHTHKCIKWLMWLSMFVVAVFFSLSCWYCSACNHNFCFVLFCLYCAFDNNNTVRFFNSACEQRKRKIQANNQR